MKILQFCTKLKSQWWMGKLPQHNPQQQNHHNAARTMECLLKIQQKFCDEVGLLIDIPKFGGSGSSNNGNAGLRFFQNAEKIAEVLQLVVSIIKMLHAILCTLSSGYLIDSSRFRDFYTQTAEQYVNLYS